MTTIWLTLPVVISLLTAVAVFIAKRKLCLAERISSASAFLTVCVAAFLTHDVIQHGPVAVAFGQWVAPFGVVFVADLLTVAMVMVTAVIGLICVIYAVGDLHNKPLIRNLSCVDTCLASAAFTGHF